MGLRHAQNQDCLSGGLLFAAVAIALIGFVLAACVFQPMSLLWFPSTTVRDPGSCAGLHGLLLVGCCQQDLPLRETTCRLAICETHAWIAQIIVGMHRTHKERSVYQSSHGVCDHICCALLTR